MLINEVCKKCKVTKKAIEYYERQGLICPEAMENGYRKFSDADVKRLRKIATLRQLGLSVSEIKTVLDQDGWTALQRILNQKELELSNLRARQKLLEKLAADQDWKETKEQLAILEKKQTILSKLMNQFPGSYGKMLAVHFGPYLNEPCQTSNQQKAFETIVQFLDRVEIEIPEDLKEYLDEATQNLDFAKIQKQAEENIAELLEKPAQYLERNREMLIRYEAYKKTDEYQNSPANKLQNLLTQFNQENGYNDIFIPAMRELSNSYREYYQKLLQANALFESQ
ncbi:MerR family transcriptional regulator [Erysipelotrichaceae bacterium RD49]|nr:MerR family transcriptional regulator [Erysipelotrichaceae bacterium RD49]